MNYLFYLGIIIPTVITIVLFVVFIYCWFLQKARKEVLTKRYDPHGKMRRLGIPMDPPSPPPYCRIGVGSDLFSDSSGEDNEGYDVSRSPSTEQNLRGRPMYRTYHDSGISAGLSLSPTQEGLEPSRSVSMGGGGVVGGGLAYRSCPDSGISGFGVHTMQTSACVHQHTCRGCCQDTGLGNGNGENIQMQYIQQHQQQQLQQQQQRQQLQQFQQIPLQQQSLPSSSSSSSSFHHQDQSVPQQVILHHNTIQASVHPSHGVCYGDDTTHPQSPQHYNPPPFHPNAHPQAFEMGAMGGNGGGGNNNNIRQQQSVANSNVNILPHIQEQPASCVLQRTNNACCNHTSPEHVNEMALQQQQQIRSSNQPTPACCHCHSQSQQQQLQHYNNQHEQQQQQLSIENLSHSQTHLSQTCSSHSLHSNINNNPQPDPINSPGQQVMSQADYVNGDGGISAIESSSAFRPKPFHPHNTQQPKDTNKHFTNNQRHPYQLQSQNSSTPPQLQSPPSYPSTSQCPPMHSYRDSGVLEANQTMSSNNTNNSSPSDRPDSQASTSSTTDSEDSGFRSSHCAVQHTTHNNTTLNKHGNPLLKPLRRPKNHSKVKSSKPLNHPDSQNSRSGNSNINSNDNRNNLKGIPMNSTPLTTLNPQNLSSQHDDHNNDMIQTTSLHDISENDAGNNRLPPPRVLHLNDQNISPNHINSNNRTMLQLSPTKDKDWSISHSANDNETKNKRQQQHFDMTDISTHLSWKYLQDMSAASSKSDSSNSSADDSHRVVSPLLRHAPPEQSVDVFSYSVV